ncbi:BON domain-containing protein [Rhodoferax sp. WC2427]|uniref:BON domain-containing protein n=1 Tax=Rhodoferax sp. WC2427 TaxID=3234144 RepID=UPI0034673B0E
MAHLFKRLAASTLLAIAAGPLLMASSMAATPDEALAETVQTALATQLGRAAKDVTVSVNNGTVVLHGWTQGPGTEGKARYIASTVPGVTRAYSKIRMFSSDYYR